MDFQNICLNETCLNKICFYHNFFPNSLTAFRSHSVSTTKGSAAVVTATPPPVGAFNAVRICSLWRNLGRNSHQNLPQCTNLLSVSHTHDTKPDIISKYFRISQKNLDTKYHSFFNGYFTAANFHCLSFLPSQSVILFKIKGNTIYNITIPFVLTQYVPTDTVPGTPIL